MISWQKHEKGEGVFVNQEEQLYFVWFFYSSCRKCNLQSLCGETLIFGCEGKEGGGGGSGVEREQIEWEEQIPVAYCNYGYLQPKTVVTDL